MSTCSNFKNFFIKKDLLANTLGVGLAALLRTKILAQDKAHAKV